MELEVGLDRKSVFWERKDKTWRWGKGSDNGGWAGFVFSKGVWHSKLEAHCSALCMQLNVMAMVRASTLGYHHTNWTLKSPAFTILHLGVILTFVRISRPTRILFDFGTSSTAKNSDDERIKIQIKTCYTKIFVSPWQRWLILQLTDTCSNHFVLLLFNFPLNVRKGIASSTAL